VTKIKKNVKNAFTSMLFMAQWVPAKAET